MLSEERLNQNYLMFINRMEKYGCKSDRLLDELGQKIKYATYGRSEEDGGCYPGALIDVTLNRLCKIGYQLNESVLGSNGGSAPQHPFLYASTKSLMRVLLLLNLSKAEMFEPETEQWKLKKGMLYRFNDNLGATFKSGVRTLFLCQKYGIMLTEEEYEAILFCDGEDDVPDKFRSPLCLIARTALSLTASELRAVAIDSNKMTKSKIEQ